MANTDSLVPQRPRRTWRQWSKLARVRIGFVLMLIVAISVFTWWWPRRGVVAVTWMGGEVGDPQTALQVQKMGRNLPDPIRTLVWPWLQPHMSWLSVDDRVTGANLSKVRSEQIDLAPLRRFTQLGSLVLHGRHVGPGLKRMTGVDSLYGLRVTGLQSTSDLGELRHLSRLDLLDITTCPDSGGGFEHLSLVSKLKRISFNGPPSSVALQGVGQCPELEAVVMSGGIVNEDDLRFLSDMKGLRELRAFGGNPAGAKGLMHIVRISSLERLVLNPTSVTDDELQALTALPKLKWLYVRGPNLSQAGTDRLKEAMPDCKIDGPNQVE